MLYIYILKLCKGKFYIGKTNRPFARMEEHIFSNGAQWTKLYKPEYLLKLIRGDDYDEDKYTLKYMKKYGIENVRGGSFCRTELSQTDIDTINKMINGANNNCLKCGQSGHYARECPQSDDTCYKCGVKGHIAKNCTSPKLRISPKKTTQMPLSPQNTCFNCGKPGHLARDCPMGEKCHKCGNVGHKMKDCDNWKKWQDFGKKIPVANEFPDY